MQSTTDTYNQKYESSNNHSDHSFNSRFPSAMDRAADRRNGNNLSSTGKRVMDSHTSSIHSTPSNYESKKYQYGSDTHKPKDFNGFDVFKYPKKEEKKESYWDSYTRNRRQTEIKDKSPAPYDYTGVGSRRFNENSGSQFGARHTSMYSRHDRNIYSREKEERKAISDNPNFCTVGLENIGNTCYINVILQCLLHLPDFNSIFKDGSYKKMLNSSANSSL